MAEGEIDLDSAGGNADEALIPFIVQLLQAAMQGDTGQNREDATAISSLSMQRLKGQQKGRIYGQAYTEKRGETVIFLRAKLFDTEGRLIMTCMATSHINQSG